MAGSDREQIVELLNLYGVAVDTQRWELFDRIYTADVDADFGATSHWTDLASFKRDFAVFHDPFTSTRHAMSGHLVHVAGDRAWAFCYGTWTLIRSGVEGGDTWEGEGWYDDELVRTPDGWRIVARVNRVIRWGGNTRVQETIPGVKFSLVASVLRREVDAGTVRYFAAIAA